MHRFNSTNPEETKETGKRLVEEFGDQMVVCLYGPLAAGKTTLVKGLAAALGVEETIVSPSYVLLREYEGENRLFHLDLFRIQSSQEFLEAGLDEYLLQREGVAAVEWADRIDDILPDERIDVEFELVGEGEREIKISPRT